MQQKKLTAAIDNDFINHIVEAEIPDEILIKDVCAAFNGLNVTAVINPFVYMHEVSTDKRTALLFEKKIIQKIESDTIFSQNKGAKNYYIYLIEQLYHSLKGSTLPVKGEEVLTFWRRRYSLGEIHSLAMCVICNYGIFLSDDKDSICLKRILKQKFKRRIRVHNRKDFFENVAKKSDVQIPRNERRSLTHER